MKILHGTNEISTVMKCHSTAQRALGHEVTSVEYAVGHIQNGDIRLFIRTLNKGIRNEENRKKIFNQFIQEHLLDYDVYHFYFGTSLYMDLSDLEILRKNGKTVIMTLCGADCHNRLPNQSIFDHFRRVYHGVDAPKPPMITRGQHRFLSMIDQSVDAFVTGTGFLDNAPRLTCFPKTGRGWVAPVDIQDWRSRMDSVDLSDKDPNKVYVLHAPTMWETKGSEFVLPVLDRLKRDGYPVEIILIQGVLPSEVHRWFARADIVIDQVLYGWHGGIGAEMMAVGKPVVCRIDPYYQAMSGVNPPVVDADPHTLYDKLARLIEDPQLRERISKDSMAYAEEHHDHMKVGQNLLDLYEALHHKRKVIQIPNPDFYTKNETEIQPMWPSPVSDPLCYEEMIQKRRVDSFETNLLQAQVYLKKGWMHQAIPFFERCVDLNPDYVEGIQKLAMHFLERFRYPKAFYYFGLLLDKKPDAAPMLSRIAEQRIQMERYHDGLQIYEFLHERNPDDSSLLLAQAKIYTPIGEYQRAENILLKLVEKSPSEPEALKLLIETYTLWEKKEKAAHYKELLAQVDTSS